MRIYINIIIIILVFASCGVRSGGQSINESIKQNDTIQFTYLYSEALKNQMLGRNDMAEEQFLKCLSMKPNSTASAYQLAKLSKENNKLEKAREYAEFCLTLKPDNEWYLLLRSDIAKALDDSLTYERIYNKLVSIQPESFNYKYELAIINFNKKEYSKSLSLLNKLTDQIGINENISFLKNHIYFAQRRFDAIKLELKILAKTYPDSTKYSDMLAEFYIKFNQIENALDMYFDILKKDSSNNNAYYGIAWLYGKAKMYKKGYTYVLSILTKNEVDFYRKSKLADIYINAKSNKLSKDTINNIYKVLLNNENVTDEFYTKYIAYLYSQRSLSEAEKYSIIAIDKFPDNYLLWDYYFKIMLILNRPEALNKYSKKALEYFPNQSSVYFYAGYSYFLLKDYKEAVSYLEMGVDYVIENDELEKQFYLTLAESYHSMGKHQNSDNYFDKYLEIDSTNAYLMNNYAYYLVQRNNFLEKALKLSRKSIEIEPFNSSFLDTYSWVLYSRNEYVKALNYIQRAYKYGGNKNPVILEHYGDILYKNGNKDEAILRWKDAYKLSKIERLLEKIKRAENN